MFGVVPILGNHVNMKRDCYFVAWIFVVEAGKTSTLTNHQLFHHSSGVGRIDIDLQANRLFVRKRWHFARCFHSSGQIRSRLHTTQINPEKVALRKGSRLTSGK